MINMTALYKMKQRIARVATKRKRQSQLKTEKQNKNLLKVKTTAENEARLQKASLF